MTFTFALYLKPYNVRRSEHTHSLLLILKTKQKKKNEEVFDVNFKKI